MFSSCIYTSTGLVELVINPSLEAYFSSNFNSPVEILQPINSLMLVELVVLVACTLYASNNFIIYNVFTYKDSVLKSNFLRDSYYFFYNFFFSFCFVFFRHRSDLSFLNSIIPLLSFTFFCILFFGLNALVPQSNLMLTSVFPILVITFTWLCYLTLVSFKKFGLNFLIMFVPQGAPIYLFKFLIVIELVSYLARFISLPARIIANAIAGHLLIKVLSCFCCLAMLLDSYVLNIFSLMPAFLCLILTSLDVVIIFIQTFVFIFLLVFYLNQSQSSGIIYNTLEKEECTTLPNLGTWSADWIVLPTPVTYDTSDSYIFNLDIYITCWVYRYSIEDLYKLSSSSLLKKKIAGPTKNLDNIKKTAVQTVSTVDSR